MYSVSVYAIWAIDSIHIFRLYTALFCSNLHYKYCVQYTKYTQTHIFNGTGMELLWYNISD